MRSCWSISSKRQQSRAAHNKGSAHASRDIPTKVYKRAKTAEIKANFSANGYGRDLSANKSSGSKMANASGGDWLTSIETLPKHRRFISSWYTSSRQYKTLATKEELDKVLTVVSRGWFSMGYIYPRTLRPLMCYSWRLARYIG